MSAAPGNGRPRNAFSRNVWRSIRGSLGRFLAIMGIVALGCGFFAGLQMSGTDMRLAADALYDGTALWDLRVISTLGLSDDDVRRLATIEGVEATMPSVTCDAMARMGDEQLAVRISLLDVDAARASTYVSDAVVESDDAGYLNRPRLVEGRWPAAADECVISADKPLAGFGVGDVVEVVSGGSSLDDLLASRSFTVVGTVSSPNYPYTGSFGSTTLGSGIIGQYVLVPPAALAEDYVYTEAYLAVAGAKDCLSESDAYNDAVGETKGLIEGRARELAKERQADLKDKAQETLDEKWDEYRTKRTDAYKELDDARKELEDAQAKIADGERQYADGLASYEDGRAQYRAGRDEYLRGNDTWWAGFNQLKDQLAPAGITGDTAGALRQAIAGKVAEARDGKTQLDAGVAQVDEGLKQACAGEAQLKDGIAQLDEGLAQARDGKAQLDDGIAQLDEGLAQARAGKPQLQDGIAQLDDGLAQARDCEAQLLEGIGQLDAGLTEARAGEAQLQDGIAQLDGGLTEARAGEVQLQGAIAQADEALAQLAAKAEAGGLTPEEEAQMAQLTAQRAAAAQQLAEVQATIAGLEEQRAPLAAQLAEVQATIAGLEEQRAPLAAQLSEVQATIAGLEEQRTALAAQLVEVDATIAQLEKQRPELVTQRDEVTATIAELEQQRPGLVAQLSDVQKTRTTLEGTKASLAAQQKELATQTQQLEQALAGADELVSTRVTLDDAARTLDSSSAQLASAWDELASAAAELDDARAQYRDGTAEWEDGKREADEKFADALTELNDAQRKIDDIELPDLYVLDRTQSEGAATYHADSERIDSIADVFPFMFFLVAALIALTTMTRMVEDERQEIGTYKALGYGTARIASRYLTYAALASVVGAVVGVAVLSQVLPYIITTAYSIIYTVPLMSLPLPIDLGTALMAGGLGVGVTLLSTWSAVVSSLREVPATLMLPRAPASGKRILLERVGPLWRRMSFSWKVTCRNLFRYKRRFFMTVVGISGCTALLLVGFGLHDSIWDIIDRQYGPIVRYNTTVGLDDDALSLDVDDVVAKLEESGEAQDIVRVQQVTARAGGTGTSTSATATTHSSVIIPRDASEMPRVLTFKNRMSGKEVPFDDNSVLVTEKLASLHGVEEGGQILLYDQDDVGNPVGEGHRLTVTGIVENYVGNLVYVGRDAWRAVDGDALPFSTVLCSVTEDQDVRKTIADDLHAMGNVSTVVFSDVTINMYRNMLSVVDMVVVVLIVSAGALAFIVLYNLTNINVDERIREIASLKVLGFTRGEVYAYIFREIAILAVMGDVLGMALGTFLERFVVTTAEVDYVMFGRTIHAPSYAYAFALTLVFTGIVMLLMRSKLDRVDMVESLKSVD